MRQKPVMLLILDGWGYRKEITPDNAIEQGHTPNWHQCLKEYPHCLVQTSGLAVGLPEGQMGNSEVGHTNLGAGRVVMQDLPKIDLAIKDGSLKKNPVLLKLIEKLKENGKTCHLMGLMSPGGVHSSQHHIVALAGILNCRFGGPHDYFGETVYKPFIGDNPRPLDSRDMRVAIRVNRGAELLMLLLMIGGYWFVFQ